MNNILDNINTIQVSLFPPQRTLLQRCYDSFRPVAVPVAVGVIGLSAIPTIIGLISYTPYIGAGLFLYSHAQMTDSWYRRMTAWLH